MRLAAFCIVVVLYGAGVARADAVSDCNQTRNAQLRLRGCSQIVAGPGYEANEKAVAYYNRGNARADAGAHAEALADQFQPLVRGRGDDRGGRARRLPQDRRAAGAARPGHVRDRRARQDPGHRRGGAARDGRPASSVPRPGAGPPRILPQQSRRDRARSVRRSSRRRWSTSSSNSPRSPTSREPRGTAPRGRGR